jgi:hypothetical protein
MKALRALVVAALFVVPRPAQAMDGCITVYNNALIECDRYFCGNGVFTCAGCKTEAWADYYGCVYYAMTT